MEKKEYIKNLEVSSLVDYVLKNSDLKINQFTFTLDPGTGYSKFIVVMDNKLIELGEFYYEIHLRKRFGITKKDLIAMTKFLDLCIEKFLNKKIEVPTLHGNPEYWDACYKS